jgi:TPP-dependent pyruvate/acetoin dehydrogenase alpha subunit
MAGKPGKVSKTRSRRSKKRQQAPPILPPPASLDAAKLKQLYSTMLGCRMMAERARLLVSQGVFPGEISVATGHEAPEVGALINLAREDCAASDRREYVARFIRGTHLERIFADLRHDHPDGHLTATSRTVEVILPGSSLKAQINLLTGAAWAFKLRGGPQVAVSLSGVDGVSLDGVREAVSFAAAYRLPIVYIVESLPQAQSSETEAGLPHNDLPCFVLDGSDVVAVYRVAQEAIRRARQGHGPALIECQSSTADNRSRPAAADGHSFEDPLAKMEAHLRSKSLWSDKWKMKLVARFTRNLDRAVTSACRTLDPQPVTKRADSSSASGSLGRQTKTGIVLKNPVIRDTGRLAGSDG